MGYNVNYQILNSADYGVPQTRKECFCWVKNGEKFIFPEPKIFFENDWVTAEEATCDLPY